ncbi:MAG: hypothetical protein HQL93_04280 [Magnetococcales bacterium]|nr:hypothetical protein [Magnetococcales bacterium]
MISKLNSFNLKRQIRQAPRNNNEEELLNDLAGRVGYGGNPEHKRNPGDFALTPSSSPRPDKTLCDDAAIFSRSEAVALLQKGVRKGLISIREKNGWPQNIWAVSVQGGPLEAQLENAERGVYHGYPMPQADPFRQDVLNRWSQS